MRHTTGERMVKGLQKEFLSWIEDNPELRNLDPYTFNSVRKRVFRSTFDAFRLGVVGLEASDDSANPLWRNFFGWLNQEEITSRIAPDLKLELAEKGFRITLQAFRVGSMVAAGR